MSTFKESKYGDLTGQDVTVASLNLGGKNIDSLDGSPDIFRGTFNFNLNDLTSLEGSPTEIYGEAIFSDNMLDSLKGNLKAVIGNLNISDNVLKDFNGNLRKVTGNLFVENLRSFSSKEEIDNALMMANIVVGGDIITDWGPFRQNPQKIADFSKNQRIGILQKFI